MLVLKQTNALTYVNFSKIDFYQINRILSLEKNVNKIEVVLNAINGIDFENEMDTISMVYNKLKNGTVKLVIYTMQKYLTKITRAALLDRGIKEGGILKLCGGSYSFNNGAYHYFFNKESWKLTMYRRDIDSYKQISIMYCERFFSSKCINADAKDNLEMKEYNMELYLEAQASILYMYPITSLAEFNANNRILYENYIGRVLASRRLKGREKNDWQWRQTNTKYDR